MMFLQFLGSAILGGALTATGLAVAGYLARAQLAHWLNKDIERVKSDYQKELEAEKASFQRELEAYKVSLIAEAERAKAVQDVKRTSALKILEMEFEALRELHGAMGGLSMSVCQAASREKAHRSPAGFQEVYEKYKRLEAAIPAISVFGTSKEDALMDRYINAVEDVLFHSDPSLDGISEEDLKPLRSELLQADVELSSWVGKKLNQLRSLD